MAGSFGVGCESIKTLPRKAKFFCLWGKKSVQSRLPRRAVYRIERSRRAIEGPGSRLPSQQDIRRDGRAAEGAPLLREYGVNSSIEGSNPSLSAIQKRGPTGPLFNGAGGGFSASPALYEAQCDAVRWSKATACESSASRITWNAGGF